MALAYEVEIAESSTTDYGAGSFTTAAFTPPNSSLLVLVVAASYSDTLTTNFSTPVGGSLTWTQRLAINDNGGADGRLEVWTAPVTTGASMTVAVDHPDAVVGVWHVTVLSFTDYDTATPTGVTATGTPTSSGTGALTLSGTPAASSYVIAARQGNTNGGLLIATPGSGWTELADLAVNSFGGLEVQIKSGGSSAVVWTEINVNGVDDVGRCTLAIEIKAATGGGEGASQGPGIVIGGSSSFVGEGAIGAPEGVGAQTLTPALFTDADTFYTPTVTPGAVALTPALYSDADTFYSPAVASLYTLTPALFADADTFYSPTVAAGAVNLSPALYTDADTFYAPTVAAGAVDLTPSLFVDADTFPSATVSQDGATQDLTPGLYADGDTFHSATVSATYSLLPALYSDADTFYAPTVATAYGLTPALFADADTFYSPVVVGEGGEQFILPPYYDDPDTFHTAQVAQAQTITQAIRFDDPDEFHAAAVFRLGHGGVTRFRPLAYG